MEVLMSLVVGSLYAAGLYLMMRRSIVKMIVGLALLGHGSNLLIFTIGHLTRGALPLVAPESSQPAVPIADPLPQALILTAIVIGFGVLAFAVVLIRSAYHVVGTDDLDELQSTDT